jgi:mycofactocin system creatininase family protein
VQTPVLSDLTWTEVGQLSTDAVLAIPLGSTEQHGPHLPLSTDTDIAVALCRRLAAARPGVLIAPAMPYGSSGEHAGFPGTLSIGQDVVEAFVVELVRSATDTFRRIVLVSAHGGNAEAVRRAVMRLRAEGRDVRAHEPRWEADPHAGGPETSILLALTPDRVRMASAVVGDTRPLAVLMPLLRTGGVRAVSAVGVLGDPTGATADEGRALLDQLGGALVAEVETWWPA